MTSSTRISDEISPAAGGRARGTRAGVGRALAAALVAATIAAGCAVSSGATDTEAATPAPVPTTSVPALPGAPTTAGADASTVPTTTTATPACPRPPAATETLPPAAALGIAAALDDPRLAQARYGISIWADGYGEVASRDAEVALIPASNQKLWTVAGLQHLLPADFAFTTEVRTTGRRVGSVLEGDLVIVAGGDTTLTSTGPHSLASIATAVRLRGITAVTGRLLVDESRYDTTRLAPGWQPDQFAYIGPQSAFVVDWNGVRKDDAYLADPARGNGETLLAALATAGVTVAGGVDTGTTPTDATPLFAVRSEPLPQLIARMLGESDNMLAESLVREVGRRAGAPTTEAGTTAISRAVVDRLCVAADGVNADGSGISRADRQRAATVRRLLQAVDETPAAATFRAGLAQAGRTGTLQRRLTGPVTNGRVWAKTGTLGGTRALAGYALTPSGREVVFAVLANGDDAVLSNTAIDELLTRVLVALG